MKYGVLRVDLVKDSIGIASGAGCEYNHFPFFRYFLKKSQSVGSDVEIDGHKGILHFDFEAQIRLKFSILSRMDQSLVEIKY